MEDSWHKFLDTFKHDFWNIFLKGRKSMHIYLALATNGFSASGWKQKSSPLCERRFICCEFMAKMLLSSCPPLTILICADLVHVVLLQGCQHARNHCHPNSPLYFLQPQSHPKGRLCLEAGLSSPPLPFSGTCTATEPTPLLDPGLQRHLATLLHQCQALHVWWVTGHIRMEMRTTMHWCSSTSMGCSGTLLHPLLTCQQKLVPSAWCFEQAKALSTAIMLKQAGSKQKAW